MPKTEGTLFKIPIFYSFKGMIYYQVASAAVPGRHETWARQNETRLANEKFPTMREIRGPRGTTVVPMIDLSPAASSKRIADARKKDATELKRDHKKAVANGHISLASSSGGQVLSASREGPGPLTIGSIFSS